MADNVTIPASGTGDATPVVATDDVSGVHFQKFKLDLGGDGASTPVSGSVPTSGDKAHDDVDSGNPVKIGGYGSDAAPAILSGDGDRVNAWFDRYGRLGVFPATNISSTTDAKSSSEFGEINFEGGGSGPILSGLYGYNGSTWDRVRGDTTNGLDVDVTRSALPTGAATSALQGGGLPSALASDRLKVDGSGVTQPVSGTFWQATQPVSGTVTANAGTGTLATSLAAGPPPHNLGVTYLSIASNFTSTTTSTNLLAGTGGQRIYVTSITVSVGGTTAGRVSIYWGTGAFTAGTSVTLLDAEFAPSTTSKPGAVLTFTIPVGGASATGDNLRITTTGITDCHVAGQAYKA